MKKEISLTHEQKVRINLWLLRRNLKYGVGIMGFFCLFIIQVLSAPRTFMPLYFILSLLGAYALLITLIWVFARDQKLLSDIINQEVNKK